MTKEQPQPWTREQALVALNLYCKLPPKELRLTNSIIVQTAAKMGRRPNTLLLKLKDLEKLDPNRSANVWAAPSKQDRELWSQLNSDSSAFASTSEQLLHDLFTTDNSQDLDLTNGQEIRLTINPARSSPPGTTESPATILARRGQQFFRQSVLNAYGVKCCISGINVPQLLVASHIKPWSDFHNERLNPRNGLCLSSLHDAAFDGGLLTLDSNFCVQLSGKLMSYFPQEALAQNFLAFEGRPISLPSKFAPDPQFLEYHRTVIFKGC